MKFLHTADWQIGMRAAHVGPAGSRVRDERIAAARRVVAAAEEHAAEFIVVAGDTFEDNAVDRLLVQRVADILASFSRSVYVLPGNHDPLCAGSVWDHPAWLGRPNLVVLRSEAPVRVDGGTLWPCPLRDKLGRADPTACIDPVRLPEHGIRIGVAHGSIDGVSTDDAYYPLPRGAAALRGLDYLAIGHWHSYARIEDGGACRMAYSGAHEPTKFGERQSGCALLVQIDAPGATPLLAPLSTGGLRWLQWNETIAAAGDLAAVLRRVEAIDAPGRVLLDLTLVGLLCAADRPALERLKELAAARLFFHRIDDTRLRPAPDDTDWIAALPPGPVRQAAEKLCAWSDPACGDAERPADAAIAAAALSELFLLHGVDHSADVPAGDAIAGTA
ncbi:MAG TPA: metallophosphoesterase [Tepidisphaeraceae bacterium]